jgi:hypothetical protein
MRTRAAAPLALLLALCGPAAAFAGGKAIDDVDAGQFSFGSMAIGQAKDVDHARAEGLGLVPASPLDIYLNGVLAKLLAQSPVQNVPAHVYVRASGDWAAQSTADANIYIALGTLLRLDNEDEVAALLAHESSHVILGHTSADVVQNVQQRAIQLSALAADAQDLIASARNKDAGASGAKAASGSAGTGSVAGNVRIDQQTKVLLLNTTLLSPAWSRDQERAADRLGTDLLVRAGYAPQAMGSLLRKQKTFESERAADPQAFTLDKQLLGVDVNQQAQAQVQKAARNLGVEGKGLEGLAGAALGNVRVGLEEGRRSAARASQDRRAHRRNRRVRDQRILRRGAGVAGAGVGSGQGPGRHRRHPRELHRGDRGEGQARGRRRRDGAQAGQDELDGPTHAHVPRIRRGGDQRSAGASDPALAVYETALNGPEPAGAIYSEAARSISTPASDKAVQVMRAATRIGAAQPDHSADPHLPRSAAGHAVHRARRGALAKMQKSVWTRRKDSDSWSLVRCQVTSPPLRRLCFEPIDFVLDHLGDGVFGAPAERGVAVVELYDQRIGQRRREERQAGAVPFDQHFGFVLGVALQADAIDAVGDAAGLVVLVARRAECGPRASGGNQRIAQQLRRRHTVDAQHVVGRRGWVGELRLARRRTFEPLPEQLVLSGSPLTFSEKSDFCAARQVCGDDGHPVTH